MSLTEASPGVWRCIWHQVSHTALSWKRLDFSYRLHEGGFGFACCSPPYESRYVSSSMIKYAIFRGILCFEQFDMVLGLPPTDTTLDDRCSYRPRIIWFIGHSETSRVTFWKVLNRYVEMVKQNTNFQKGALIRSPPPPLTPPFLYMILRTYIEQ